MFTAKTNKKNKRPVLNWENQIEAWRGLGSSIAQTGIQESKNIAADALRQITSFEKDIQKLSGDLQAGESLNLSQVDQHSSQAPADPEYKDTERPPRPGIDYFREFSQVQERRVVTEDTRQVQVRIDQILVELRKLTSHSAELAVQFEDITMEETPREPGTYHLNFFEWVFSVIQKARERIEESQTWLAMFKSKKKQKGYWNMFKKHGTTFGLSSERVVATQTG